MNNLAKNLYVFVSIEIVQNMVNSTEITFFIHEGNVNTHVHTHETQHT